MKVDFGEKTVVIGKRVTIGGAIGSIATGFSYIFPEQAPAIIAFAFPVTFIIQIIVANYWGVTTK